MHGDYYLNKRFSDEYLTEMATLLVCMFLADVIALIVGWATSEMKFTIHNSSFSNQNSEGGTKGTASIAAEPQPSSIFSVKERVVVAALMTVAFGSAVVLVVIHKLATEGTEGTEVNSKF